MTLPGERVVLVDANDQPIGVEEKLSAHRRGAMHRAFSVFVWDRCGRLLLQRRALTKYHSGGLWTNTCCGHPRPEELVSSAAERRLQEEMGFVCPLTPIGTFSYRADVGRGLIENEFVHLFSGAHEGSVSPDPAECEGYDWQTAREIQSAIEQRPQHFSVWFKLYVAAGWPLTPGSPQGA